MAQRQIAQLVQDDVRGATHASTHLEQAGVSTRLLDGEAACADHGGGRGVCIPTGLIGLGDLGCNVLVVEEQALHLGFPGKQRKEVVRAFGEEARESAALAEVRGEGDGMFPGLLDVVTYRR
jgi:hypothetical protein